MEDKVRAKIVSLVPEIMDLDDGARVLLKESFQTEVDEFEDQEGIIFAGGYNKYHILSRSQYPQGTVKAHMSEPYTKEEIEAFGEYDLGRPITLADVLRAIHSQLYFEGKPIRFSGSWVNELVNMWNLTLDYDGQTQEVKEFLGRLLGV